MSEQHTQGPWEYGVRQDGSIWLSLGDHTVKGAAHFQGDLSASEADARLITAAPDLLAALQNIIKAMPDLENMENPDGESMLPLVVAARAAIAKVKGEKL